jgi:hypothetical protein
MARAQNKGSYAVGPDPKDGVMTLRHERGLGVNWPECVAPDHLPFVRSTAINRSQSILVRR